MIDQKVGSTHLFANMCAEERLQEEDLELHAGLGFQARSLQKTPGHSHGGSAGALADPLV